MELLLLASGMVVGTIGLLAGGGWMLGRSRERCPACNAKGLKLTGGSKASARTSEDPYSNGWSMEYTCTACGAQFARWKHGGLIPKEAWDRGVREAPPKATVVED